MDMRLPGRVVEQERVCSSSLSAKCNIRVDTRFKVQYTTYIIVCGVKCSISRANVPCVDGNAEFRAVPLSRTYIQRVPIWVGIHGLQRGLPLRILNPLVSSSYLSLNLPAPPQQATTVDVHIRNSSVVY